MKFHRRYQILSLFLIVLFIVASNSFPTSSQSRRQPPTTNEKKNKRPSETPKEGDKEQQEPLPPDLTPTKPQDIEKLAISTNVVTVDAVVYHKKSGRIVTCHLYTSPSPRDS